MHFTKQPIGWKLVYFTGCYRVPVMSLGLLEQNVLGVDSVTGVSFSKLVDISSTVGLFL